jgi:uncharacterized membrane protein YsdA (DUF1294 family)
VIYLTILIIYLSVINLIGFILMGYDKSQARNSGQRVPEKRLFSFALLGASLGIWLGLRTYRHKTKHMTFVIGLPALLILNIVCVYFLVKMMIHI